jgi:hypothetical protein
MIDHHNHRLLDYFVHGATWSSPEGAVKGITSALS